jgi:hypothetical protein
MPDNLANILEVAIGVTFVFLLLSLLATTVAELISRLLLMRAKTLRSGVARLLGESQEANQSLTDQLFGSSLLRSIGRAAWWKPEIATRWSRWKFWEKSDPGALPRPSYMSASTFSSALLSVLAGDEPGGTGAPPRSNVGPSNPSAIGVALFEHDARTRLNAIFEAVNDPARVPEPFRRQFAAVYADAARTAANARELLQNLEDELSGWFDTSMERVTGWYKRQIQVVLFGIGLATALFMNVDTLEITRSLYDDPQLRASVVEAASSYVAELPEDDLKDALDAVNKAEQDKKLDDLTQLPGILRDLNDEVLASVDQLEAAKIPIGWARVDDPWDWNELDNWALRVAGWLLTALAVSLGAPFWFDMLNKLVALRGAGAKPAAAEAAGATGATGPSAGNG